MLGKKHKRYCMPLADAVSASIEKARPLLKNKFRIDDKESHCMFCLEGETGDDPIFHSGCACRPDSGMSIGHIRCFQEFARASFADEEKKDRLDSGVNRCSHCSQDRYGILKFEMCLILWKLCDPDCLTRESFQGNDSARVNKINDALVCLVSALREVK